MTAMPAAEVAVTTGLVRALLREQHPDLGTRPLRIVANGWDNVMLRLGDDLAVRVPRRAAAAQLVLNEQRCLPVLAPRLPVAAPVPVRVGVPSDAVGFPWPWSVVPWIEGRSVTDVAPGERAALARPLADVMAALHVAAPADAPENPVRGVPLATREAPFRDRVGSGVVPDGERLLALWTRLARTPAWDGPPVWLHGDPHPANLVATPAGDGPARLAAVVDFGDVTSGDPASDLATAWLTFGPDARTEFRARVTELSGTDDATWDRALGWAIHLTAVFLAHSDDAPHLRAIGEHALAQVLAEM